VRIAEGAQGEQEIRATCHVRCIADHSSGIYGYAGTHEWVFGVFEFAVSDL
jgi:hypothetical protein